MIKRGKNKNSGARIQNSRINNLKTLHAIHDTQYELRTASHGDFFEIRLIFGVQFSIILNKLNI